MNTGYGWPPDPTLHEPSMRLRHLEIFNAVMLTGSASGAARLLRISQPAVTKMLAQAEDQAGFRLFGHGGGRLVPTAEAQALFGLSRKAFSALEEVRQLARNLRESRAGRIRIATIPALSMGVLPLAVQRFLAAHPGVGCEVATHHTHEIIQNLLHHELDVGFAFNVPQHEAIRSEIIAHGRMVAVAAGQEAGGPPITLRALAAGPFIGLDQADPLGSLLHGACQKAGVELNVVVRVQTYHTALQMVGAGVGVAVVDLYTALAAHGTVTLRDLDPPLPFTLHALTARSRPSGHLVDRFVAHLKAAEREVARAWRQPGQVQGPGSYRLKNPWIFQP